MIKAPVRKTPDAVGLGAWGVADGHADRDGSVSGIEAAPVDVQVQLSPGQPWPPIVRLPDKAVKESDERPRAAERHQAIRAGVERRRTG
jgi:hypothetical protein